MNRKLLSLTLLFVAVATKNIVAIQPIEKLLASPELPKIMPELNSQNKIEEFKKGILEANKTIEALDKKYGDKTIRALRKKMAQIFQRFLLSLFEDKTNTSELENFLKIFGQYSDKIKVKEGISNTEFIEFTILTFSMQTSIAKLDLLITRPDLRKKMEEKNKEFEKIFLEVTQRFLGA